MLIGFFDDTEVRVTGKAQPDIYVLGGFFIPVEQVLNLQERIFHVKEGYNLQPHAPVKWNLKDSTLKRFYRSENWLGDAMYQQTLAQSHPLRRDLLSLLDAFDTHVLVSARYDQALANMSPRILYGWAFENLLQRAGLMAQGFSTNQSNLPMSLVLDWPQGGVNKHLFDIYTGGFHFGTGIQSGQNYHSGSLRKLNFADSIAHGSALHSCLLQMADLVSGCAKDFLSWAYKSTKLNTIKGYFEYLINHFYRDPRTGQIGNFGFKVAKDKSLDIDAKIAEFLAL